MSGAIASWRIGMGLSRRICLVLCAMIVWFGAPAVALASTGWSTPTEINGNNGLSSVSCPTSSFCVAVSSQNGAVLIYQDGSWGSPSTIDIGGTLSSVSCSSDSYCVAIDTSGNAVIYANGSWGAPKSIDSGGQVSTSVSCPASAVVPAPFCVAVDINGRAVIDQSGTWGAPETVDSGLGMTSVSCPSASFCTAVGLAALNGGISGDAVSYNGASWSSPTTVASGETFLDAVSCSSPSFCAAVGTGFVSGALEGVGFTWNGNAWSSAQGLVASATIGSFSQASISCTSGSFCQAVYSSPDAALFNGTSWDVQSGIDTAGNLAGVSCPTQGFCEAVDAAGNALSYTATIPVPVNTAPPTISGSAVVGQTLSDVNGTWTNGPVTYAYQWEDCNSSGASCSPIGGAESMAQSYLVQNLDIGHTIRVQETASNAGGKSSPATSLQTAVVVPPVPVNTSLPSISGNTTQGQKLTESHASWTNSPTSYAYQWQECNSSGTSCSAIAGATSQAYILTASNVGHTIRVQETASNAGGKSSPASSAQTAVVQTAAVHPPPAPPTKPANYVAPLLAGVTTVDQKLATNTGAWTGTPPISYAFQWQRCRPGCSDIGGANGNSYTLTSADQSAMVQVIVTATNSAGSGQVTSNQVGPISSTGPTAAQIKHALSKVLGAHGKNARIKALLKHGGYAVSFQAPSTGRLVISWYELSKGAQLAKTTKRVLVATVSVTLRHAGKATIKIVLTRNGRKLLKHSRHLKLTAKGIFGPTGQSSTSMTKTFAIKR